MTTDKNLQLVKSIYSSFQKGDVPAIVEFLAEDCQWGIRTTSSEVPWHRSFNGKSQIPEFFKSLAEETTFTKFEPHEFLASDNHVCCLVTYEMKVKRTGKIVRATDTHHFFFKNNRVSQWVGEGCDSAIQNAWTNGRTPHDNQTLAREYFECMDTRDLDGVIKLCTPTAKFSGIGPSTLDPKGMKEMMTQFYRAFPDSRMPIESVCADGNEVSIRHRFEGTQRETFMGIAPTNKRVSMQGTLTLRTNAEGQITEGWLNADMLGLYVQLGAITPPRG